MTRPNTVLLIALTLLAASCKRNNQIAMPLSDLTRAIMADREDRWHCLLDMTVSSPDGEIAIIGDEKSALNLAKCFMTSDTRDNATASRNHDMLPDFAGETFSCIIDFTNKSLSSVPHDKLCEILLRHVLSAVDTVVHVSPYDIEGISRKAQAKMIVVSNPFLAHHGLADADSLLRHFNCHIPVITPMDVMFDKILSQDVNHTIATVGILCNRETSDSGIYTTRFKQASLRHGHGDIDCVVFPDENSSTPVKSFMDKYIQYNDKPLDVMLVDGTNHDLKLLKAELAQLVSLMNEESVTYRKFISDNFVLLESKTSVVEECYDMTRRHNMFSHHISAPRINTYYNIPSTVLGDGSYFLIPGDYVQN